MVSAGRVDADLVCQLDYRRLVHPDEGRYAEIPREMVVSGDWVTPRLDGIKYFEKPALQYWLTAAGYEAFGVHHWTARLWPALSGYLGVLFIGYVGLRLGGPLLGLYSAAALAGCLWYVLNGPHPHARCRPDAVDERWPGAACLSRSAPPPRPAPDGGGCGRRGPHSRWRPCRKGLIGIVLPGGALVVYSLLQRDWALWRRLHLLSGAFVFAVLAVPWFALVSARNPEFFDFFFIHEHFTRFLTTEHRRPGAWWYFVPVFIGGILPWLSIFVWAVPRAWRAAPGAANQFHWQRFALIWAAFIFLFFSASGSKLPSYILPIFPALALVVGWQLLALPDATLARLTLPLVVGGALFALFVLFAYAPTVAHLVTAEQPLEPLLAYGPWIKVGGAVPVLGGALGWWWLRRGRRTAAVLAVSLSSLIGWQLLLTGYDVLAESRSSEPILARIVAGHGPLRRDVPFYSIRMYDQTLPYYLGRTVVPVDYTDELAMGIGSEPEKAIDTVDEWRRRWEAADEAYAIMQPDEFDELQRAGVPMVELGRDPRRVIVARR